MVRVCFHFKPIFDFLLFIFYFLLFTFSKHVVVRYLSIVDRCGHSEGLVPLRIHAELGAHTNDSNSQWEKLLRDYGIVPVTFDGAIISNQSTQSITVTFLKMGVFVQRCDLLTFENLKLGWARSCSIWSLAVDIVSANFLLSKFIHIWLNAETANF